MVLFMKRGFRDNNSCLPKCRDKAGFEATLGHDTIQNQIPETETMMEFIIIPKKNKTQYNQGLSRQPEGGGKTKGDEIGQEPKIHGK